MCIESQLDSLSMEFKGKAQRTECYGARDLYFECLDANKNNCKELYANFEQICGKKWTEHFIKRRDYLKFKEKLEKGGLDILDEKKLN